MVKKIAIIDCGTNTFHLLIANVLNRGVKILHSEKKAVRIGEGGINEKTILPEAEERAIHTIEDFKATIKTFNVTEVHAFATSAFRNATNGQNVKDQINKIADIDIKIISGDEEAEFIFYGVNAALDIGNEPSLIMDIGGGSVEFIIGKRNKILWKQSFEIGAQRLLYLFHKHDPIEANDLEKLEAYLADNLSLLLSKIKEYNPATLIGSSGTFDTLSEIYCLKNKLSYNNKQSELPLTSTGYQIIHKELIAKDKEQRLQIPGMIKMRVDMIVVASSLIYWLLNKHHFRNIRVSTFSLKEGVLNRIKDGHF